MNENFELELELVLGVVFILAVAYLAILLIELLFNSYKEYTNNVAGDTKKCPSCGEQIAFEAKKCRYCDESTGR